MVRLNRMSKLKISLCRSHSLAEIEIETQYRMKPSLFYRLLEPEIACGSVGRFVALKNKIGLYNGMNAAKVSFRKQINKQKNTSESLTIRN